MDQWSGRSAVVRVRVRSHIPDEVNWSADRCLIVMTGCSWTSDEISCLVAGGHTVSLQIIDAVRLHCGYESKVYSQG